MTQPATDPAPNPGRSGDGPGAPPIPAQVPAEQPPAPVVERRTTTEEFDRPDPPKDPSAPD